MSDSKNSYVSEVLLGQVTKSDTWESVWDKKGGMRPPKDPGPGNALLVYWQQCNAKLQRRLQSCRFFDSIRYIFFREYFNSDNYNIIFNPSEYSVWKSSVYSLQSSFACCLTLWNFWFCLFVCMLTPVLISSYFDDFLKVSIALFK